MDTNKVSNLFSHLMDFICCEAWNDKAHVVNILLLPLLSWNFSGH